MLIIKDTDEQLENIMKNGSRDSKKRASKIWNIVLSKNDKAKALGLLKNNQLTEGTEAHSGWMKLNDEMAIGALKALNSMKRNTTHEEHLFLFYLIHAAYDGVNRDQLFKRAFKYVEERSQQLKKERNYQHLMSEYNCIELFRVGTVNGRSWMSCVHQLMKFNDIWKYNSEQGLLNARIYRKIVCEDDVLIYCESSWRGESEVVLTSRSIRDCSLTERLYETDSDGTFSIKDSGGNLVMSYDYFITRKHGLKQFELVSARDTEYVTSDYCEKTESFIGVTTKDSMVDALFETRKKRAKIHEYHFQHQLAA